MVVLIKYRLRASKKKKAILLRVEVLGIES
nr:MAG TPA: hypothetical protein [Caudoviricetes sp.]